MIDTERASNRWAPGRDGDTTYLCTDRWQRDGGLADPVECMPGSGPAWSSRTRGSTCTTVVSASTCASGHPAEFRPGHRPPHTLCPAMATADGALRAVFGTMGGDAQPQILLQVAARLFHYGQSPAAAIDAGRWALHGPGHGVRHVDQRSGADGDDRGSRPRRVDDRARRSRPQGRGAAAVRQRLRARPRDRHRRRRLPGGRRGPADDGRHSRGHLIRKYDSRHARRLELLLHRSDARRRRSVDRGHRTALRQRRGRRVLQEPRRVGQDRRSTRLRHDVAHRAPLPVRGLRGAAEPHPVRSAPGACSPRVCASGRCSTSCRNGIRCAWPRTSPSPTSSPVGEWSSASVAAPCPARRGRSARWSPAATTRCRPSTIASTARSSKSRWRSSSSPGTRSSSAYRGKHLVFPPDDVPDRGTMVNDLTLIPKPLRKVDIYQPVTSPETIEYVPRAGHKAVYWLQNADSQKQKWDRYAEIREACGTPVGPGEDRCLVLNLHVATTREAGPGEGSARTGRVQQVPVAVRPVQQLPQSRRLEGRLQPLPHRRGEQRSRRSRSSARSTTPSTPSASGATCSTSSTSASSSTTPGLTRDEMTEQMHLVAEEVFPRLGEPIERRPITGSPLV